MESLVNRSLDKKMNTLVLNPLWLYNRAGLEVTLGWNRLCTRNSVRAFTERRCHDGDAAGILSRSTEVIKNDGRRLVNCQLRYENNFHYSIDFRKDGENDPGRGT